MKFWSKKTVYLDNAATTPVRREVLRAMRPFWNVAFGNPSSIHALGVEARRALGRARQDIARAFNARPQDVIFTGGGTSGNATAPLGLVERALRTGWRYEDIHVVTTTIEHSSVRELCRTLKARGVSVTEIPVAENGVVSPRAIRDALRPETLFVSVMYANNEIGTIQPIREIAKEIRHFKKHVLGVAHPAQLVAPYFHVDACQAPLYLSLNTAELGADLIVIDAQKIYGPKGIGALWMRAGIPLEPLVFGGGQEKGLVPGTENVPLAVGLATALSLAVSEREGESLRLATLRDWFIGEIRENLPGVVLNGDAQDRLPNNINLSIPGYDTEFLTLELDVRGFAVSTKSACLDAGTGSYVVSALGGEAWRSSHTLRISLGKDTYKRHLMALLRALKRLLVTARAEEKSTH